MNSVVAALLSCIAAYSSVPVDSVPSFNVNLNDHPRQRWVAVTEFYRDEGIAMAKQMKPIVDGALGDQRESVLNDLDWDPEYLEELQGIVDTYNRSDVQVSDLQLSNMLYELGSPTIACSGVLWAMPNGTVFHGRNMDYVFLFEMPDGRVLNWPDVTFEVTFIRDGQPLMKSTHWPGDVGIHTAMRFGGWSFEQNTRAGNDRRENLAIKGGQPYGNVVRRIMETTPDFETAVERVYAVNYMAPQYFIMSGSGPYQGAVLTIDRNGRPGPDTPPIQYINHSSSTAWHLVQTNDDLLKNATDPRRPIANRFLSRMNQSIVSEEHLLQFMHTPLLFNPGTVFTTVMSPATGRYLTVLPSEPPFAAPGNLTRIMAAAHGERAPRAPRAHPRRRRGQFLAARRLQSDDEASFLQTRMARLERLET